jgi:hypothetical protein
MIKGTGKLYDGEREREKERKRESNGRSVLEYIYICKAGDEVMKGLRIRG